MYVKILDCFVALLLAMTGGANRWIIPVERRTDFLNLHTGMKFDIPFDQLVLFATNSRSE